MLHKARARNARPYNVEEKANRAKARTIQDRSGFCYGERNEEKGKSGGGFRRITLAQAGLHRRDEQDDRNHLKQADDDGEHIQADD